MTESTAKDMLRIIEDQRPAVSDKFVSNTMKRWSNELTVWGITKGRKGKSLKLVCYVPQGDSEAGKCDDCDGLYATADLGEVLEHGFENYCCDFNDGDNLRLAEKLESIAAKLRKK